MLNPSLLPSVHYLTNGLGKRYSDTPLGVMTSHFSQIAVVADVIANAILVGVAVFHGSARELFGDLKRFQYRATIGLSATDVIDLARAGILDERMNESGNVFAMDVVADLLAFVAEDPVFTPLEIALHQIAKKSVQLDAGMVRAGQTSTTQGTGRHAEISPVFLDHDIGGNFRSTEERVLRLVDRKAFRDPMLVVGAAKIPTRFQFIKREAVGTIAVNLVG